MRVKTQFLTSECRDIHSNNFEKELCRAARRGGPFSSAMIPSLLDANPVKHPPGLSNQQLPTAAHPGWKGEMSPHRELTAQLIQTTTQ